MSQGKAVWFCGSFKGSVHVLHSGNKGVECRYHIKMVPYPIVRYLNATETTPTGRSGGSDTSPDLKVSQPVTRFRKVNRIHQILDLYCALQTPDIEISLELIYPMPVAYPV